MRNQSINKGKVHLMMASHGLVGAALMKSSGIDRRRAEEEVMTRRNSGLGREGKVLIRLLGLDRVHLKSKIICRALLIMMNLLVA